MAIQSFACKRTEALFQGGHPREFRAFQNVATRKQRLLEVAARPACARSTTWELAREVLLTAPVRRGPKWSRWPSAEVDRIEVAINAGASDDEPRALVRELMDARSARGVAA